MISSAKIWLTFILTKKQKSEFYNMLSKDVIMQKLEKDEQYFETY